MWPTPRGTVAAAKFLLLTVWILMVTALLGPIAVLIGMATGLGAPDGKTLVVLGRVAVMAVLTGLVALTVAVFASIGYLAAFGGLHSPRRTRDDRDRQSHAHQQH